MSTPADRSRARERRHDLGEVDEQERVQLAARFGSVLRLERGHLTQQQLADAAGLDRSTIVRAGDRAASLRRRRASGS